MINPVLALSLFFLVLVVVLLLFWPEKGLFWKFAGTLVSNEKTLMEDVLKQIYHMEHEGNAGSVLSLKGSIDISEEKLVKVIAGMESKGLIRTNGTKISLRKEGSDYAVKIIRAHRLWEKYLADKTGVDKRQWHHLAELAEHKLTKEQVDDLALSLGDPRYDPHGDPIPTSNGDMQYMQHVSLPLFPVNKKGYIVHIEDEPESVYEQIIANNLQVGAQIIVIEANERRIRFTSEGEEVVLTPIVANNISVAEQSHSGVFKINTRRLTGLKLGEKSNIVGLSRECRGANRRRLLDLGFIPGTEVETCLSSPLGNPRAYLIKGASIALRKEQSDLVLIEMNNNKAYGN